MPGKKHNDTERRLLRKWIDRPASYPQPLLKLVRIASKMGDDGAPAGTGLRGIKGLAVPFNYPLIAICGKNGVGKSTVLALSALAFNAPASWYVSRGHLQMLPTAADRDHFIFPDFFHHTEGDISPDGITISWHYHINGAEKVVEFQKTGNRWARYTGRPERTLDYAAMNRVLPATELRALRRTFAPGCGASVTSLNTDFRKHLSDILGRKYAAADVRSLRGSSLQACKADASYTGFNMGAGESSLIILMNLLQRLPKGGLLVIEEVELGLHHEAQARLAQKLLKIALDKELQVVCTTHSEPFLDALPREARLLIRRNDDAHDVIPAPTTRYAVHEMSGELKPELHIYCEDGFAARLLDQCLTGEQRPRVRIASIGSDVSVVRQIVAHERGGHKVTAVAVLDGDRAQAQIDEMLASAIGGGIEVTPTIFTLPGSGQSPESWALTELAKRAYTQNLARELGCTDSESAEHIKSMSTVPDPHDIFHRLAQRTGIDRDECARRVASAVSRRHPQLDPLRESITKALGT